MRRSPLTDTLILDEDGLYDPGAFNDRLLLGLKGQMSEAPDIHGPRHLRGAVADAIPASVLPDADGIDVVVRREHS